MPPIHRIAAVRRTSLSGLLLAAAVTSCTASEGSFTLQFAWQGGSPPPNLPANLFMYATITAPG